MVPEALDGPVMVMVHRELIQFSLVSPLRAEDSEEVFGNPAVGREAQVVVETATIHNLGEAERLIKGSTEGTVQLLVAVAVVVLVLLA